VPAAALALLGLIAGGMWLSARTKPHAARETGFAASAAVPSVMPLPVSTAAPETTTPPPLPAASSSAAPAVSVPSANPAIAKKPDVAPAKPSCRIITEYDGDGQPHFKKVCK
jgi:hypothetical protein